MANGKHKSRRRAQASIQPRSDAPSPAAAEGLRAERPDAPSPAAAEGLRAERRALNLRRGLMAGIPAVLLVAAAAALLLSQGRATNSASAPTVPPTAIPTALPAAVAPPTAVTAAVAPPTAVPTAAPAAVVPPTAIPTAAPTVAPTSAAPAATPTAPPTAAPVPTAIPAPAAPQAPVAAAIPARCVAPGALPVYSGAVCIDYDADEDDGVIKHKSTYTTSAPAEDVRRFYEDVFARQGWAVLEFSSDIEDGAWEYEIAQSQRQLKVKVDAEVTLSGTITEIKLEDK